MKTHQNEIPTERKPMFH